jgi:hypothetical protein
MLSFAPTILSAKEVNALKLNLQFNQFPFIDTSATPHALTNNGGVTYNGVGSAVFSSGMLTGSLGSLELPTGNFLVKCQFTTGALTGLDGEVFCLKPTLTSGSVFILVEIDPNLKSLRFNLRNDGDVSNFDFNSPNNSILANTTYTVLCSVTGTSANININGTSVASATLTGTRGISGAVFLVGSINIPSIPLFRYFDGSMDYLEYSRY